jgi:hypothetical protein
VENAYACHWTEKSGVRSAEEKLSGIGLIAFASQSRSVHSAVASARLLLDDVDDVAG